MSTDAPSKEAEAPAPTPTEGANGVAGALPPHEPEPAPCPPKKLSGSEFVTVPSYSRWFNWHTIHECEVRSMPEFFDGTSGFKSPSLYKYLRNSIIKKFRANPSAKITFTEVRRTLVGDVGSIRRVFDFLDTWGLINYSPSTKQQQLTLVPRLDDNKEAASSRPLDSAESASSDRTKKLCSGCKSLCSIACFVCDKYDLVLCARCYVRGNYRVGLNSSEFRRVEIAENVKTNWTEKETLHLLEALMHYGDNWMRVAEHVGGRTEKDCVARFIKLPFGEQYVNLSDQVEEEDSMSQTRDLKNTESTMEPYAKKIRLTPLADASNPIMAQSVFLSALAGTEVAEAAAAAAIMAMYDADDETESGEAMTLHALDVGKAKAEAEAELLLKGEEDDVEKAISSMTQVQMEECQHKIDRYEEMELQLEKEWQQLDQMKHQLFVDQLVLLFNKDKGAALKKSGEVSMEETGRTL